MGIIRIGLIIALIMICFLPSAAAAPAGSLDASFNYPNGYTLFNSAVNNRDRGVEVVVQQDGKIVVLGYSHNGTNEDILLVRYHEDGTLDVNFGAGGFVLYDGGGNDRGLGLALQTDGKIIATGFTYVGSHRDVILLRYHADGTLDDTFGTGGVAMYSSAGAATDIGFGVVVQTDGDIIVVGETSNGTDQDALVLRFTADGSLDNGFGRGGVFVYAGPDKMDRAFAAAVQQDGKIIVVGASVVNNRDDALVFRLNPEGILDGTFGTAGVVTYSGAGDHFDYGNAVALRKSGEIVMLGATSNGLGFDVLLLQYDINGNLDTAFGSGGMVIYGDAGVLNDYGYALVIQEDNKIVVTGYSQKSQDDDVLVLRFNPNGTLDNTFGNGGIVMWNGSGNGADYGQGVALQPDGKLIIAGFSHNGNNEDVLVMRLWGAHHDGGGRCFIATAAYGSSLNPHVVVLRKFRDEYLINNRMGRELTMFYNTCSPPLASLIERHDSIKTAVRCLLVPTVLAIQHPGIAILGMVLGSILFIACLRKKF